MAYAPDDVNARGMRIPAMRGYPIRNSKMTRKKETAAAAAILNGVLHPMIKAITAIAAAAATIDTRINLSVL
jgi:hypothetical protein